MTDLSQPARAPGEGPHFLPKLVTVLREGYSPARLWSDVVAALTVAIVALPLSMGIAIASGATPERGLFTAIVAGFLISAFGGSRFQIGGPTAAFIVVVYRIIERHGYEGLALATMMAGVFLIIAGLLRLGSLIRYIPYPVTIGFTAGIGLTIFVSQIGDLLGLTTPKLPGDFVPKVEVLAAALPSITPAAALLSVIAIAIILVTRRLAPKWPGMLIAVAITSLAVALLHVGAVTIGTKFGVIPSTLPAPAMPAWSIARLIELAPDAATIALLAGIESLLSAVVADSMAGSRHRSNGELVAQGIANLVSPLFGGLPATGALARTATNIRAGSTGPVSGMLHALFLLVILFVAAPLMAYVPLAALAAILTIVAWNMSEVHSVMTLIIRHGWSERIVLAGTFFFTVFFDLTIGIGFGVLASIAFALARRLIQRPVRTGL